MHRVPRRRGGGRREPGTTWRRPGGRRADPATACTTRWRSRAGRRRAAGGIAPPPISGIIAAPATARGGSRPAPWSPSALTRQPLAAGVKGGKSVGCGGCHDPHRWNPADAADRGGAAAGDAAHEVPGAFGGRAGGSVRRLPRGAGGRRGDAPRPDATGARGRGPLARTLRHGICAPCHSVHGAQPLAVAPAATAEAGGKAGTGKRPLRGLPRRGEDRLGRDRRRARASGRREPGAGLRARLAAVRLHRQAPGRREDRLRDLPRPAQLVARRRLRGDLESGDEFPADGRRRLRPALLPLPRRKVHGRRHGPRPAGDGPDGRESRRAERGDERGLRRLPRHAPGAGGAGAVESRVRRGSRRGRAAPAPAVIGPATTRGRTSRPARRRTW